MAECAVCLYENPYDVLQCEMCGADLTAHAAPEENDDSENDGNYLFGGNLAAKRVDSVRSTDTEVEDETETEFQPIPVRITKFKDTFDKPIDTELLMYGYLRRYDSQQRILISDTLKRTMASFISESYIWRLSGDELHHFLNRKKGYRILSSQPFIYNVRENYSDSQYNITLQCCLFAPKIDSISSFYDDGVGFCWRILSIPAYLTDFDFIVEYKLLCKETRTFFEYQTQIAYSNWSKKGHGWPRSESAFILKKQQCVQFNELTFICQIDSIRRQIKSFNANGYEFGNEVVNAVADQYSLSDKYFKS